MEKEKCHHLSHDSALYINNIRTEIKVQKEWQIFLNFRMLDIVLKYKEKYFYSHRKKYT